MRSSRQLLTVFSRLIMRGFPSQFLKHCWKLAVFPRVVPPRREPFKSKYSSSEASLHLNAKRARSISAWIGLRSGGRLSRSSGGSGGDQAGAQTADVPAHLLEVLEFFCRAIVGVVDLARFRD